MGMLRAPPHNVPGILGHFGTAWDGLGRLGRLGTAWNGFGKLVGPCRTKQVKNIENSARYQVLAAAMCKIVDGFIEHRQAEQG